MNAYGGHTWLATVRTQGLQLGRDLLELIPGPASNGPFQVGGKMSYNVLYCELAGIAYGELLAQLP